MNTIKWDHQQIEIKYQSVMNTWWLNVSQEQEETEERDPLQLHQQIESLTRVILERFLNACLTHETARYLLHCGGILIVNPSLPYDEPPDIKRHHPVHFLNHFLSSADQSDARTRCLWDLVSQINRGRSHEQWVSKLSKDCGREIRPDKRAWITWISSNLSTLPLYLDSETEFHLILLTNRFLACQKQVGFWHAPIFSRTVFTGKYQGYIP